jgi:hypothetical protein
MASRRFAEVAGRAAGGADGWLAVGAAKAETAVVRRIASERMWSLVRMKPPCQRG